MSNPSPITKEEAQEALDLITLFGSERKAATASGISNSTLHNRATRARALKLTPAAGTVTDSNRALKDRVLRLEKELNVKDKVADQVEVIKGVIGSIRNNVETFTPPKFILRDQKQDSPHGVPTLFLSDLHWGEVIRPGEINNVNEYNIRIAHARMQKCIDSAVHLLKILSPKLDYPGIVVPLGGDMISGNIHEELTATNELNTMPTVIDLYGVLVGVIETLADTFGHVFLPCVSGNHGRDTRKIWGKNRNATSFDWLLYRFLAKHFEKDKRVTFYIPDGSDAFYRVYNHAYLLTHGDQFRGGDSMIGCLGPILRGDHKKRSRNAQVDMEYDTMIMGHWHQYIHHTRVIVNGSLKGYDEYAFVSNFGFEPPQQALWLTHPKYGITYRMPVYVDKSRHKITHAWVSVPA